MAASAKEKMANATARIESKFDKSRAVADEKADKVLAHNEEGKLEATERKHECIADAEAYKEHKLTENEHEKLALQHDLDARKAGADDTYKNMDTGVLA